MHGLSLVAVSGGHSSSWCAGLSLLWPLLLRSTSSRRAGSLVVVHGPSCSAACGIFPEQGSNPRPRHRQADSQPLRHQGSPSSFFFYYFKKFFILIIFFKFLILITLFYYIFLSFFFVLPFLLSHVADRVLVLQPGVRPKPLRWES